MSEADWTILANAARVLAVPIGGYIAVLLQRILREFKITNARLMVVEVYLRSRDEKGFADTERLLSNGTSKTVFPGWWRT